MSNDGFGRGLTMLGGLRGVLGESRISETRAHGPKLNVITVLLHGVLGTVSGGMIALCLWGLGTAITEQFWHWYGVLGTMCAAGVLFWLAVIVNQWRELLDTFWRKSPAESALTPALAGVLESWAQEAQPDVEGRWVPLKAAGDIRALMMADEGRPDNNHVPAQVADLVDFVALAGRLGLSRRAWLGKRLPSSGHEVTREMYDALIDTCDRLGYIERGGEGVAHTWRMDRSDVLRALGREMGI